MGLLEEGTLWRGGEGKEDLFPTGRWCGAVNRIVGGLRYSMWEKSERENSHFARTKAQSGCHHEMPLRQFEGAGGSGLREKKGRKASGAHRYGEEKKEKGHSASKKKKKERRRKMS